MKYNLRRQEEEGEEEGDSDCEIQQLKQKIRLRRQQIRRSRLPPCTASQHSKATIWGATDMMSALAWGLSSYLTFPEIQSFGYWRMHENVLLYCIYT